MKKTAEVVLTRNEIMDLIDTVDDPADSVPENSVKNFKLAVGDAVRKHIMQVAGVPENATNIEFSAGSDVEKGTMKYMIEWLVDG